MTTECAQTGRPLEMVVDSDLAVELRTEGEKLKTKPKETKKAAAPAVVKKRTPRATLAAVKKALDEGDTATAGTTFRRLWRR